MLCIDFEVFLEDWLCVVVDFETKKETVIVNDRQALCDLYEKHKRDIWVGYNIRNYDQYILKAILCDFDPKDVNDFIIVKRRNGYQYSRDFNSIPLIIFDVMPQPPVGLKTLEGFMGLNIHETAVSFDIDRKLTKDELESTIGYCRDDVYNTIRVFTERFEEFSSQLELVKMFKLPADCMGKTKPQLTAIILGANKTPARGDEFNFTIPETLRVNKYKFVVDWFIECRERAINNLRAGIDPDVLHKGFYSQKLECDVAGVPHIFAWGGIHGARPNYEGEGYFVNVDVASYYPSMMIRYNYHSRNIHDPQKFTDIYHTRLTYKKQKDKRANPLKIVLNSTYGALKDKFNALFDPLMANNVCVTGQLLLLDLIEHLEPYCYIIQSNTDGILVKLHANNEDEADREWERVDTICCEWEQRTGMNLEFDEYRKVIQRDVNNYIIIDPDGGYKSKGGEVKKLNNLDFDLPIINKAMIAYFTKGVPVKDTILACNDLREFQKIVKVSSLYLYGMHNGERLEDKTFRVFASTRETDGMILKVKKEGAKGEKFANTPDHCFIDNSEVLNKSLPDYLDAQWYIHLAEMRIARFAKKE